MTKRRLADTSLVLLDEVSMVSSRMFTTLIYAIDSAHANMSKNAPWRIVVFGDFFQLPPVRADEDSYNTSVMYALKPTYWMRLFHNKHLELRYVWRQEDKILIAMLSRLRVGEDSVELAEFLQSRSDAYKAQPVACAPKMSLTRIFPHRRSVNAHNLACLSTMERENGCARGTYEAMDYPIDVSMTEQQVTTQLEASVMAPKKLEICVGARVADCAAICDGQAEVPNGIIGEVIKFVRIGAHGNIEPATVPVVQVDTVQGPFLLKVKRMDMKLHSVSRDGAYASRYHVPLVLAWAVTVHRCQGLSIDAAVLYLAPRFVDGMVYVALSRVRFMEGVHVLSFDPSRVRADRRVACFYDYPRDIQDEFAACVDKSCRS